MEKKEITVGKREDFPVGKFVILEVEGREIGIAQLKNGEFRAVRNHCPHKGAPVCKGIVGGTWLPSEPGDLVYGRDGEILVCPWHGFEFDLMTGEELFNERPLKLLTFPVQEKNGEIVVTM